MNKKTLIIVAAVLALIILGPRFISIGETESSGSGNAQISLMTNPSPLRLGQGTFIISVKDDAGNPVDDARVTFDLNMTTMNMGTQEGVASAQGNGNYAVVGRLSMKGPWKVSTKVTMPDGKEISKDFSVNVP